MFSFLTILRRIHSTGIASLCLSNRTGHRLIRRTVAPPAKPAMFQSEQQQLQHSLESSPTFATTATTIMEIDDEDGCHVPPVLSSCHNPLKLKPMIMVDRQEQRDQSDTSEATSSSDSSSSSSFLSSSCSSFSSASTAVTLADSISNDSCSPRSTPSPLHQALRDYSMDALLASSVASRAVLEHDILQHITAETACVFDATTGHLPLHLACRAGLPYAVVERLVMVYPAAVRIATRDSHGLLPLHILCRYYAGSNRERTKLLGFLLRRYPAASRITTTASGELPLHLLCHNYFCSTTDLALLIKYYPHAIDTPSKNKKRQNLPIHIACGTKYMVREQQRLARPAKQQRGGIVQQQVEDEPGSSSDEIIQFLAQQYPTSLTMANGKGELPFHAAIRGYQSLATLRFLLQAYPSALATTATDGHGRTALHLAVSRHEPCRLTIRALLETTAKLPLTMPINRRNRGFASCCCCTDNPN
jgi:hypothetical protein